MERNIYKIGKELFITSDKEIKKGDWVIYNNDLQKSDGISFKSIDKKIILTTDIDLIKTGVQAIDDVFLEWFVKNPGCVFVEIKHYNNQCRGECGICDNSCGDFYKIIIPQEQPKQETLEEAANTAWLDYNKTNSNFRFSDVFALGAKWQAERMFDDEEVLELLLNIPNGYSDQRKDWFKRFRKNKIT
jgi:hypothetical protein